MISVEKDLSQELLQEYFQTPTAIVEFVSGNIFSSGNSYNVTDWFKGYRIDDNKISDKEFILNLFKNEVHFDEEDYKQEAKMLEKITVKIEGNFFDDYD